ncbi:MAG TPA: YraN family protein [Acidimicrobiia bacterium]
MGHVSPRPLPRGGPGPDLQGRLRGAPRRFRADDLNRADLGRLGEAIAGWFLARHGLTIVAANVRVGRGEIDILADDNGIRVAVEVRTTRGRDDPVDAADPGKREQASRLARRIGARRFDVVGIGLHEQDIEVHWVPAAS